VIAMLLPSTLPQLQLPAEPGICVGPVTIVPARIRAASAYMSSSYGTFQVESERNKQNRMVLTVAARLTQLKDRAKTLTRMTKQRQPGSLILVRHGQSTWNDENRFTGWANVPLSDRGREEAQEAANLLLSESSLEIDACYTSVLCRSVETANICLDTWERDGRTRPEMFARWRLNERHYGMLTGLNKREALNMFSAADLRRWRSSFEGKPPPMDPGHPHYSRTGPRYERLLAARTRRQNEPGMSVLGLEDVPLTESLADTRARVTSLWESELRPQVMGGKNLLVGHQSEHGTDLVALSASSPHSHSLFSCYSEGRAFASRSASSLGTPTACGLSSPLSRAT